MVHLIFLSIWFGGVIALFPLIYGVDLTDHHKTYSTYLNMRVMAWNVIGWGGIGSVLTGILNGLVTSWGLFRYKWVTIKLFAVMGLVLFGMFFMESNMLKNLDLLETRSNALADPEFIRNHRQFKLGLIIEALVFSLLVSISIFKPWRTWKKMTHHAQKSIIV